MSTLGIEIGGTKLQLVLGDDAGKIHTRRKLAVAANAGAAGIRCQIQQTVVELRTTGKITKVGVGFGGPVAWKTGKICCSHHIEGWSEFDLGDWLQGLTDAPVIVDNDGNVAALGEARCGAGVGCDPVFYVTLGSGVGGGLVTGGAIYHGATPGESEIGHVRLDRSGMTVESRCSGWAVDARIRESIGKIPKSVLGSLIGSKRGNEAGYLVSALGQGDFLGKQILAEVVEDLAFGLSHVVHLFHPQVIVLGGGLSGIGEPLRAGVEQTLRQFTMTAFAPGPAVRLAGLGEDTVPVGALCLARGLASFC